MSFNVCKKYCPAIRKKGEDCWYCDIKDNYTRPKGSDCGPLGFDGIKCNIEKYFDIEDNNKQCCRTCENYNYEEGSYIKCAKSEDLLVSKNAQQIISIVGCKHYKPFENSDIKIK